MYKEIILNAQNKKVNLQDYLDGLEDKITLTLKETRVAETKDYGVHYKSRIEIAKGTNAFIFTFHGSGMDYKNRNKDIDVNGFLHCLLLDSYSYNDGDTITQVKENMFENGLLFEDDKRALRIATLVYTNTTMLKLILGDDDFYNLREYYDQY